jgi:hypothetical protein
MQLVSSITGYPMKPGDFATAANGERVKLEEIDMPGHGRRLPEVLLRRADGTVTRNWPGFIFANTDERY